MIERKDLIEVRPYREGDRNFIFSTWLRGLYYGDSWFSDIPKHIFMESYHGVVERILASPATVVSIACLKEDPDTIVGYSVAHTKGDIAALDWIFVKSAWRKIGVARSLVPTGVSACTHLTRVGRSLKPATWDFNPFIL